MNVHLMTSKFDFINLKTVKKNKNYSLLETMISLQLIYCRNHEYLFVPWNNNTSILLKCIFNQLKQTMFKKAWFFFVSKWVLMPVTTCRLQ